jgi:sterol desaturase/sphingolipid hydroxylase (fatty acid hydroxylase superfamily)
VAVTYLLTEAHSGYDLPCMAHNLAPAGLLGGPPRHEAHHRTSAPYYHQFFTYLDYALGHAAGAAPPPRAPARGSA